MTENLIYGRESNLWQRIQLMTENLIYDRESNL